MLPTAPGQQAGGVECAKLARALRELRHEGRPADALTRWKSVPKPLRVDPRIAGERVQILIDLGRTSDAVRVYGRLGVDEDKLADFTPALAIAAARVRRVQGNGAGARQLADSVLAKRPRNVDARILQLLLLGDADRWGEAGAALDRLSADLGARRHAELEAELLAGRAERQLGDDTRLDHTVALLREASEQAPWRYDIVALRVQALLRWQRLDLAEELALTALEAADTDARGLVNLRYALGTVYRSTDRGMQAKACFELALSDDLGHVPSTVALARCLGREGRREEALSLLDAVSAQSPYFIDALLVRADLAEGEGDMETAEQALRDVLTIRPKHLKTMWRLSRLLARLGQMDEVDELVTRYEARKQQLAAR